MSSSQESHPITSSSGDQSSKDENLLSIIVRREKQSQKQPTEEEEEEARRQRREECRQKQRKEKQSTKTTYEELAEVVAMIVQMERHFRDTDAQEELAKVGALTLQLRKGLKEEGEHQALAEFEGMMLQVEAERVIKEEAQRHVEELEREIEEIWSEGGWSSCAFPESYQIALYHPSQRCQDGSSKSGPVKICCETSSHPLCRQDTRYSVSTTTSTTTIKATSRGLFRSTSNNLFGLGSLSAPPRAWVGVEVRIRQLRCLWRDRRIG